RVERTERDVARAEMIQRQAHAERPQALQRLLSGRTAANQVALVDLELEAAGVERVVRQRLGDGVDQAPVEKLLRRQVDRQREIRQLEAALPRGKLAAPGLDHPFAGGMDEAAGLEDRQEACRWEQPVTGMLPAQERFEPDQAAAADV